MIDWNDLFRLIADPTQPYQSIMWVLIAAISVLLVAFILSLASMRRKTPLVWGFAGRTIKYRTSATPSPSSTSSPPPPIYHVHPPSPPPSQYYFNHSDHVSPRNLPRLSLERRCTTRLRNNRPLHDRFNDRFTTSYHSDDDCYWANNPVQRCDTVKAGRICWLQLEEQAKMARLRKKRMNDDPQYRLANILHSSLGAHSPGQIQVPLRRRRSVARLVYYYQSQPDLKRFSTIYPITETDKNGLILTALWFDGLSCVYPTFYDRFPANDEANLFCYRARIEVLQLQQKQGEKKWQNHWNN